MTDAAPAQMPVWPGFGLIIAAHCLGAMNLLAVLAAAPVISADLGLSAVQIGFLASAYSAALAGLSIPSGRVADAIGVRASLVLGAMVMAMGAFIFSLGLGYGGAIGGISLCGAGYSLVNPAAGRAVMMWFPADQRGTLMGIKQTGVPLGGAIGTSSALLVPLLGWQGVIGGIGATTALFGVLFLLLPAGGAAPKPQHLTLREEFATIVQLFRNPMLARNNTASGLINGAQFILWSYLTEVLRLGAGLGLPLANACLSILHISSVGGRLFWGWFSDRVMRGDSRGTLLIVAGIATLGLLGFLVMTPGNALVLAPVLAIILGVTACSATGVQIALTTQSAPPAQVGGAIGYNMLATNIGGVILPPAFGYVYDITGSFALAWVLAASGVVLACAMLWIDWRSPRAR